LRSKTSSIFDAHNLAIPSHAGQIDKGGQPHILHLARVADAQHAE
jgi:hypothetical protein